MTTTVRAIAGNHPKYAARLIREFDGKRVLNASIARAAGAPEWAQGKGEWRQAIAELRLDAGVVFTFLELQEP